MALRTPMKKTQFGFRHLLANGGYCPVEVFCRLRSPEENNNDQQHLNKSVMYLSKYRVQLNYLCIRLRMQIMDKFDKEE